MIRLKDYREYWEGVQRRLPEIKQVMPVTVDEQMGKKLQTIGADTAPVLFYFPPAAESTGRSVDAFRENNLCVIFVMDVYDPQRRTSYETLESLQPLVEKIKHVMVEDQAAGCPVMRFDVSTLNTQPETEFYRNFAGWSIGFTAQS